jgi:HSP20 family protein
MRLRRLHVRYARSDELAPDPLGDPWRRLPSVARPEWRPPCDVYETASEWIVKAEIAGLDDEQDVEVQVYEDTLVIEGRRPWRGTAESRDLKVHAAEIRHGAFRLAVRLPEAIDREAATRSYERGLLLVRLPKARSS